MNIAKEVMFQRRLAERLNHLTAESGVYVSWLAERIEFRFPDGRLYVIKTKPHTPRRQLEFAIEFLEQPWRFGMPTAAKTKRTVRYSAWMYFLPRTLREAFFRDWLEECDELRSMGRSKAFIWCTLFAQLATMFLIGGKDRMLALVRKLWSPANG